MKEVYIEHNPYTLETVVTINGKAPASNSAIPQLVGNNRRLQDWVDELPGIILKEANDAQLKLQFRGTISDFDDVYDAFIQHPRLSVEFEPRIPGEEPSEKIALLEELFEAVKRGPFPDMYRPELAEKFEQAISDDFEVCVVAPVSAGKSTLINALLHKKLMPSMAGACTAIITRLADTPLEKNVWNVEGYDTDGNLVSSFTDVTLREMKELNSRKDISLVEAKGRIPLAEGMNERLVLIDTPGPNNAQNAEHAATLFRYFDASPRSLVLYILNNPLQAKDNDILLKDIADKMRVGGRTAAERFIFVLNKMDDWNFEDDGPVENAYTSAREFLKTYGIANPLLFLASAQTALDIHRSRAGQDAEDLDYFKRRVNRRKLEQFSSLTSRLQQDIAAQVEQAEERGDSDTEALLHSGLPSVEASIRRYVQKYAKTTKIFDFGTTLQAILSEKSRFEEAKKAVSERSNNFEAIRLQLEDIEQKLKVMTNGEEFKRIVPETMTHTQQNAHEVIETIQVRYQSSITEQLASLKKAEYTPDEAQEIANVFASSSNMLTGKLKADFERLFNDSIASAGKKLAEEYKKTLQTLEKELGSHSSLDFSFSPLSITAGSIHVSLSAVTRKRTVTDKIKNENKRWWKFWTWFEPSYFYVDREVRYIFRDDLLTTFSTPMNKALKNNISSAKAYFDEQCAGIQKEFDSEFEKLNDAIARKLEALRACTADSETAQKELEAAEEKLQWLEDVQKRLDRILDI